jgi:hypothetical protein
VSERVCVCVCVLSVCVCVCVYAPDTSGESCTEFASSCTTRAFVSIALFVCVCMCLGGGGGSELYNYGFRKD